MSTASSTLVHSTDAFGGKPVLGVIAARTYRLVNGRLTAAEAQPLDAEECLALHRPTTDVLLNGSAHTANGAVTELSTALRVGDVTKRVDVVGDRRLQVSADGRLRASRAEPFQQMPLSWDRAYGGRDHEAEELLADSFDEIERYGTLSYPRNRDGRGFFIDTERARLDGALLPNLSDPDDPVKLDRLLAAESGDWVDRPMPAGYAAIDPLTFPRCVHYRIGIGWSRGGPPRELALDEIAEADLVVAGLGEESTARACNRASLGLGMRRLEGNERVSLFHLHRRAALVEFDLPGERPRLVVEPPNTRTYELEVKLATVLIEPDVDRVTLCWAGSMPVAAVYPEQMCAEMRHAAVWA